VLIPMWISRSMPSAVRIDTAWALAGKATISPAHGASRTGLVGSMATPSPSMRPANTGAGASSSGPHQPSQGARICSIDISSLLPDLDPVERPEGVEPRTRKTQAQIMAPREPGQALRGRREQQSDVVAAEFELVSVAAQSGVRIDALVPRPRGLFGFDEGRGAYLRTLRHAQRRLITRRLGRGFAAVERIADA